MSDLATLRYAVGDPDPTPDLDNRGEYCFVPIGEPLPDDSPHHNGSTFARTWYCTWPHDVAHDQHVAGIGHAVVAVRDGADVSEAEWAYTDKRRAIRRSMDDGDGAGALAPTVLSGSVVAEMLARVVAPPAIDPALLERLDSLKRRKEDLARDAKRLQVEIDEVEAELVEQYVNSGKSFEQRGDRVGTLGSTLWARKVDESVTGDDVAAALRADGLGHLVTNPSYNSSRLSGYLRDLEQDGKPIPPNLAKVIEAVERYAITFSTRRPTRATRRVRGEPSSVLDPGAASD